MPVAGRQRSSIGPTAAAIRMRRRFIAGWRSLREHGRRIEPAHPAGSRRADRHAARIAARNADADASAVDALIDLGAAPRRARTRPLRRSRQAILAKVARALARQGGDAVGRITAAAGDPERQTDVPKRRPTKFSVRSTLWILASGRMTMPPPPPARADEQAVTVERIASSAASPASAAVMSPATTMNADGADPRHDRRLDRSRDQQQQRPRR